MRDLLKELVDAKNKRIYKDNDFKKVLTALKNINEDSEISWDEGAGEEWAFLNNQNLSIMLNTKIAICFVRGILPDDYIDVLNNCNCVSVDSYDLKEWFVDLEHLRKNIPEIIWHTSGDAVDEKGFSLDELYFATV